PLGHEIGALEAGLQLRRARIGIAASLDALRQAVLRRAIEADAFLPAAHPLLPVNRQLVFGAGAAVAVDTARPVTRRAVAAAELLPVDAGALLLVEGGARSQ